VKKIITSLCVILLSVPTLVSAQSRLEAHAVAVTLKDAILLALRNNPGIKQDEIERISEKFALVVAKKQFEPRYQLDATAGYNTTTSGKTQDFALTYSVSPTVTLENHYGTQFSVSATNPSSNGVYTPGAVLSVTQPLIRGFGKPFVEAALNDALDTELVNKLNFKNSAISIVAKVINDYLALVQDYETLQVDKQSLKNYKETVSNDKALIAAGRMAKSDIVQAQAQVEQQLATIENDYNSIYQARNTLLNDLGLPPYAAITVPKRLNFRDMLKQLTGSTPLGSAEASEKIALSNNIPYQAGIIAIRESNRALLQARDKMHWKLNLTATEDVGGGGTGNLVSLYNGSNHAESVALNLSIPVDNVSDQSTLIQQEVGLDKALIALKDTKRKLIETVGTDYRTIGTSRKSLSLSKSALKLQEETVYIAQQKQLAGRVSTFEVLTNQKTLDTSQVTVVQNQIAYLEAIVAYEQELGVLLEPWHIKLRY
jgi:outer membrane protein TolC